MGRLVILKYPKYAFGDAKAILNGEPFHIANFYLNRYPKLLTNQGYLIFY